MRRRVLLPTPKGRTPHILAEEVLILPCIEEIPSEHVLAGDKPKSVRTRHGGPQPQTGRRRSDNYPYRSLAHQRHWRV